MTTATLSRPRKTAGLPIQLDQLIDITPDALIGQLGDAKRARRWLNSVATRTPEALEPHLELSRTIVVLERALPGAAIPGSMDVESALARDDWQTAYDLAMNNTIGSAHALASLLLVVDGLNTAGQSDAVLNLLGRAMDLYEGTPAVYWALSQVLLQQGRMDDAESALTLLQDAILAVCNRSVTQL